MARTASKNEDKTGYVSLAVFTRTMRASPAGSTARSTVAVYARVSGNGTNVGLRLRTVGTSRPPRISIFI
jgi:hypothetical protein